MKRRLVLLIMVILAGALLYQLIQEESGYVLIAYGLTSIEMSLWTALGLLLSGLVIALLLWRLVQGSRRMTAVLTAGGGVVSRRAQSRSMDGLVDFIEGNWLAARKKLVRHAGKSVSPLVNYLAAARSAYEVNDFDGALELLHKAERAPGSSALAVALTQARMQLGSQRFEQCLATLKRIRRIAPTHPVVLDLLTSVYLSLGDYEALEELLPQLRELGIRKSEALESLEITVFSRLLAPAKVPPGDPRVRLDEVWQRMPARLHKHPEIQAVYAMALNRMGAELEAEPLLRKSLQQQWQSEWIDLYGRIAGADIKAQLQQLERWQVARDPDPVLLCALGRLSLRNQLWGRARDYFRQSLELQASPEVYAELGRLLQHLGEREAAESLYREGLMQLAPGLPDLPQPKILI